MDSLRCDDWQTPSSLAKQEKRLQRIDPKIISITVGQQNLMGLNAGFKTYLCKAVKNIAPKQAHMVFLTKRL